MERGREEEGEEDGRKGGEKEASGRGQEGEERKRGGGRDELKKRGRRRGLNSCLVGLWLFRILDSSYFACSGNTIPQNNLTLYPSSYPIIA